MAKVFNTTGTCYPQEHYMVDTTKKMKFFEGLIDRKSYFCINRARQFGKTTTLRYLYYNLGDEYLVIPASFEVFSDNSWDTSETFSKFFCTKLINAFETKENKYTDYQDFWSRTKSIDGIDLDILSKKITEFCVLTDKKVVLLIDEVDKAADNDIFLKFLGMLRNKYLERDVMGEHSTFWSVILAGVYDIKNLKLKLRPEDERKYNSPWNIAVNYKLDMTFNPQEISTMLVDYENDNHIGFDIMEVSEEIYRYTSGYPVLVSAICKEIDEYQDKNWTKDGILKAAKMLLNDENFTLFDDISKNLSNYPKLHDFLYDISVNGVQYSYSLLDPILKMAKMFSYIKSGDKGNVEIHNLLFEEAFNSYFINEFARKSVKDPILSASDYVKNGDLDMSLVINRFSDLMSYAYKDRDQKFLEYHGRLMFLCFIKPIINGTGFCYFESQTKNGGRMDLVVTYNHKEYIVELKIWRGEKYELSGRDQLAEYLATRNQSEGYLVTFSFLKSKTIQAEPEWIEHNGKRIFEAVIDCVRGE